MTSPFLGSCLLCLPIIGGIICSVSSVFCPIGGFLVDKILLGGKITSFIIEKLGGVCPFLKAA
jgi:hypothetical protein